LYPEVETELLPLCVEQGIGVIVYNPIAVGFLSGKYQPGPDLEEGTHFTLGPRQMDIRGATGTMLNVRQLEH
jgi:aryl-alcohol dehydrogenase-like predicted oxidoreductase